MDRDRLAEIDALFAEALERPTEERSAFLAERCGADEALRCEVVELLALAEEDSAQGKAFDLAGSFLQRLTPGGRALQPGAQVGAYTLVRRLAEGGMGVVFLAERTDGSFERRVALKVLPEVLTSPAAVQRFERERQILARLQHPNIAHLLDGGIDPRGLPYLVMEYVEGLPLDQYCDQRRLPIEERIRLVITIAHAVQAAHRNLVVHRDLKPDNLLVSPTGEVTLLDFGIAKLSDPEVENLTLTRGALPLTPTYASPELVSSQPITTASDVYQLGLILYELLTGYRPQPSTTVSWQEWIRRICDQEPAPPSRAVLRNRDDLSAAAAAALRRSTPTRLARHLRPDLDAIVARALAKAPEERYATPDQLANDLERFLTGHPIQARRTSLFVRTVKWMRRNAVAAAALGLVLLLTLSYAATTTLQARWIAEERDRARQEAQKAAEVERFLMGLFEVSDPARSQGRSVTARELLQQGAARAEVELEGQPEVQARMFSTLGQVHGQLGHYEQAAVFHRRALALRRGLFGERHPEVAESLHRLGYALRKAGEYDEAEGPLRRAVELRRTLPEIPVEALGESLLELGYLHYFRGEDEAAEALFRENLHLPLQPGQEAEAVNEANRATALNALGMLAQDRGRGAQAEGYYRQALVLWRRAYGDLHPAPAVSLYNVGRSLQMQEDYAAAQPFFEEAMAIEGRILGEEHPEYARTMMATANNLQILGRLEEADRLFLRVRDIFDQSLETVHPERANLLQTLGQLRRSQGRLQEAEELLREAIDLRRRIVGDDHVQVALLYFPLAQCLRDQGRYWEALTVCEEGLAIVAGRHPLGESQLTNLRNALRHRLQEVQ